MTETKQCTVCGADIDPKREGSVAYAKRKTCSLKCAGISRRGRKYAFVRRREYEVDGEMSFEQIGAALGVTQQRAWQIYNSAMRKLREGLGA